MAVINEIKKYGKVPALAVNPDSDIPWTAGLTEHIGMVLFMTVFPGFEGQKFMPQVLPKIKKFKEEIDKKGLKIDIEVDGGINEKTAANVIEAGANVLVAGSAIFYSKDYKASIESIRNAKKQAV